MYTRGRTEDMPTDGTTQKLLKAVWFELVETNKKIDKLIKMKEEEQNESKN